MFWSVSSKSVLTPSQTGKDEYDASVKAEEKAAYAIGSVFQGLRADLEGFVSRSGYPLLSKHPQIGLVLLEYLL
jgi:hypothetical protein